MDLDLLCQWLDKPHVKEWWDDKLTHDQIRSKYRKRIGNTLVAPFIAYLDEKPIGFIQYYHADKIGDGWWTDEVTGTLGLDQFIGEETLINHGYGTLIIRAFIDKLFLEKTGKKIITDVDPNNHRAIRCYEKVGFKLVREVMTPDGLAYLMELSS